MPFTLGLIVGSIGTIVIWTAVGYVWIATMSTNMQDQRKRWWYKIWR